MMTVIRRFTLAVAIGLIVGVSGRAEAGLALDFTGGTASLGGTATYGWSFLLNTTTTVSALGIWDEGSNGLATSHELGLWDSSEALLASATITNANSVPVSSINTAGRWLFTDITPLTLSPGTYYLGAGYADDDTFRTVTDTPIMAPGFVYNQNQQAFGILNFPLNNFDFQQIAYFGPNLLTGAVPEPSSLILCGIAVLSGLGYARRRTKRVATA